MTPRDFVKTLFLSVLGTTLVSCGGHGGGSQTDRLLVPYGTWRGALTFQPGSPPDICAFNIYGDSYFKELTIVADTEAFYYSPDEPSRLLVSGLIDFIPGPVRGSAGYTGDGDHVSVDVQFDILERDLPAEMIRDTGCSEINETVFSWIDEAALENDTMIVSQNFNHTCRFPNGSFVDCTHSYQGELKRAR